MRRRAGGGEGEALGLLLPALGGALGEAGLGLRFGGGVGLRLFAHVFVFVVCVW